VITPTSTATPAIEVASVLPSGTPRPLVPLQPLADAEIVDRPLRNVRTVTDGSRQYRVAAWAPGGPFVALLPQDGPGLDLIDLRTAEVTAVVTGTYVLEPQWTDEGELLIHRAEDGVDSLLLYDPEAGFEAMPLHEGPRLAAPSLAGGTLAFSRDRSLLVCPARCAQEPIVVRPEAALVTAPAPEGPSRGLLAWTPVVTDLEDVQTFVAPLAAGSEPLAPWALSEAGEGLWLPRWSPDGSRVALTSVEGRIVVAAADGSARNDMGPGDAPAWSPDGTLIAYAGASAGLDYTTRDIHLVRGDGSGRRLRMTDAVEDQLYVSPSWSPDGKQLAFVELDTGQLYIGDVPLP
jgi:dipeptidyl aminopeptidase/acylaminoacyl peptidase